MPEGHTVHRIALQLEADFVGERIAVSSPQGRFAAGAALLDGLEMVAARAVGKHLLVGFDAPSTPDDDGAVPVERDDAVHVEPDGAVPVEREGAVLVEREGAVLGVHAARWLRVHLGLYGAWDFHGRISPIAPGVAPVGSMGAPRLRRAVRMGEGESTLGADRDVPDDAPSFPPEPVGQVRVRLATARSLADLRGPTACEVLTPHEAAVVIAKAGPDPRVPGWDDPEQTFVDRLRKRRVPVGVLLMDQSVVSGIGNIYRAEMLFRARLDPFTPGAAVPADVARGLWRDWVGLLDDGVRTGVMITREDLDDDARAAAVLDRNLRHAIYGRAGEPCLVCGTPVALAEMAGRKLYWCPTCQT
ncbi:Fpg/Nei family DNA glycosylase [Cellulomonas sp. APG4]|uniref:Fpg/Nei family DNA glycosylase n=1 Tax=Cellulomonas sp. APG4 TaxID=1538656 RepID=UPI00137B8149|nr:Fpg/Nei family DNA glycosylase [Cellulomonas sp. APG4]